MQVQSNVTKRTKAREYKEKDPKGCTLNLDAKDSEGRGLTRPAMGVGSLLIFFTRPGLIELSNLATDTQRRHTISIFIKKKKKIKKQKEESSCL